MRQVLFGILVAATASGAARAQFEQGDGIGFAALSGRLVGAAMACGVPSDRALVLGRRAITVAQKMQPALNYEELARVHAISYEQSFSDQRHASPKSCPSILRSYKQIEDKLTLPKR